jgi:hypothetical protein
MKETQKRRRTVTSFLNEIAIDQMENRAVKRGKEQLHPPPPPLFLSEFQIWAQ